MRSALPTRIHAEFLRVLLSVVVVFAPAVQAHADDCKTDIARLAGSDPYARSLALSQEQLTKEWQDRNAFLEEIRTVHLAEGGFLRSPEFFFALRNATHGEEFTRLREDPHKYSEEIARHLKIFYADYFDHQDDTEKAKERLETYHGHLRFTGMSHEDFSAAAARLRKYDPEHLKKVVEETFPSYGIMVLKGWRKGESAVFGVTSAFFAAVWAAAVRTLPFLPADPTGDFSPAIMGLGVSTFVSGIIVWSWSTRQLALMRSKRDFKRLMGGATPKPSLLSAPQKKVTHTPTPTPLLPGPLSAGTKYQPVATAVEAVNLPTPVPSRTPSYASELESHMGQLAIGLANLHKQHQEAQSWESLSSALNRTFPKKGKIPTRQDLQLGLLPQLQWKAQDLAAGLEDLIQMQNDADALHDRLQAASENLRTERNRLLAEAGENPTGPTVRSVLALQNRSHALDGSVVSTEVVQQRLDASAQSLTRQIEMLANLKRMLITGGPGEVSSEEAAAIEMLRSFLNELP